MKSITKIVGIVALVFLSVAGLSILFCFPLMWSWNYVMPYLFGLKTLSWGQAWCLSFVCGILIKSSQTSVK